MTVVFLILLFSSLPALSFAFSDQSDSDFLAAVMGESDSDESFLNKARVDSSYFLAEGLEGEAATPESLMGGDGFLGGILETQWKKKEKGITLVKNQQKYKGLSVFGGEVVTRKDASSTVNAGFLFKGISMDPNPGLAKAKAEALIKEKFGDKARVEGELGVLPVKTGSRLVYRFNVFRNLKEYYTVYLDANTGDILRAYNQVDYFNAGKMFTKGKGSFMPSAGFNKVAEDKSVQIKPVAGSGDALNNQRVPFPATEINGQSIYVLADVDRKIFTLDALNQFRIDPMGELTPGNESDDALLIVTDNKEEWNNPAAVSGHYHANLIYRFLEEKLKRKSLDGKGLPIRSIVNAVMIENEQKVVDNAFYAGGAYNLMVYLTGSWDGQRGFFKNLAGSLDVAAHEFAHGVTDYTSNLEYINESGAINESFSDMFGVAVEYFYDRENFEWAVGEDIIAPSNTEYQGGLRLLDDPRKRGQPDTYKGEKWYGGTQDQGGVHTNSGVGNKAFYLMAEGGAHNGVEVPGIGMEKAIQIAYRANQIYMNTRSQYMDCARGFILAAKDLYGEGEARNVYLAWKAVNLKAEGLVDVKEIQKSPREVKEERKTPEPQRGNEEPEKRRKTPPPGKPSPSPGGGFLGDIL